MDWGFRATHVVALAGKGLAAHFYREPPRKSYFMGCSTGGRQALQAAQRFPWDFDGIVAGAPPIDLSMIYMTFAWAHRAALDPRGKPLLGKPELKLLTDAALARCDLDDGAKDGVIGDPWQCSFDPAELTCPAGKNRDCLTAAQVSAAKSIYTGPQTSQGKRLSTGGPVVGSEFGREGSDFGWASFFGPVGDFGGYAQMSDGAFRYLFFVPEPGPMWKLGDLNFDRDYQRFGVMESLYSAGNPDLRRFKAAGGKLLIYHGLNDNAVPPSSVVDYYETVERTMGGRKETQDFLRLFLLPGVGHCAGGAGAGTVDYLSALETWVEESKAPDRLIASSLKDGDPWHPPLFPLPQDRIQFTRPVFPYPMRAQYDGHGDRNDATSFSASATYGRVTQEAYASGH
jgi:feruloyl esterase